MALIPRARQAGTTRLGTVMIVLAWLIVLGLLTMFFDDWLERERNPNRAPVGQVTAEGAREVVLVRNRQGHYLATGRINGHAVEFLLDTGATTVSVPGGLAEWMGLRRGPAQLSHTANGTITVYATVLDTVELGPIVQHQVRANINPHMQGDEVLLGMSFLKNLHLSQQGGTLTLRQEGP